MTTHHKYGGSTIDRSLHCHKWHALSEGIPRQESDVAADGTAMHEMLEESINDPDYEPDELVGKKVAGRDVTQDMADKVYTALECVDELENKYKFKCRAEVYHAISDDVGGTADLVGMNAEQNIFLVGDLKTGDGVQVYAENNPQLKFYTWLMVSKFADVFKFNDQTKIVLAIIQPSYRRDEPLDVWETSLADIINFGKQVMKAVTISESGRGFTVAGKWCKFCPAMSVCPVKTGQVQAAMRIDPQHLESLNDAMAIVDDVEDWVREVRKFAHEQAEQGVAIDGWKLVAKRATRQWVSEKMAEEQLASLGNEMFTRKLISPAQAEKICKKKGVDFSKLSSNIESISSGTTLAHADDKRPAAVPLGALAGMIQRAN